MEALSFKLSHRHLGLGLLVELAALLLIPAVIVRRKEPSSTAAWILALVFFPGLGAALFLLFGRDRVRIPAQWKRDADRELASRLGVASSSSSPSSPFSPSASSSSRADEASDRGVASAKGPIFRVGAALAGVAPSEGNEVELLVDGDATYAAIGAAIDAAKRTVHAEYYLIRAGATADWFRERLIQAAKRGVEVRLLVDGYGSFWLGRRWLAELRAAGARAAVFLPARLLLFQPMNLRNHRKIVVVDGEVAFTGGLNIGDEYRGTSGPWRDMHLQIRGPAVARLEQVFAEDWHFCTSDDAEFARSILVPPPPSPTGPSGSGRGATVAIVRSGPDVAGTARETIHRVFFSAITTARERVYITTPYFVPDRAIVIALQTAALRGVDVKLILPGKSNHPFYAQAGRSFYEELLSAGVGIFEYGPGMIHAKTMVIDGAVALVGSANMDVRSFHLNFEVHAVMSGEGIGSRLEACFREDLAASNAIVLAEFQRRPLARRVVEGLARFVSPLM